MAFGNFNNRWLRCALGGEKLRQLLSQKTSMGSHDTVFAAVIPGRPLKDVHPDLLFSCGFRSLLQGAFSDVEEEFTKPQRAAKLIACNDPFDQE